jgi:hypothetical protein
MRDLLEWLRSTDLISLALEVGIAFFILIALVRCALG